MFDTRLWQEANRLWRFGESLEAGKLIYENLTNEARVTWASEILKRVSKRAGITSDAIESILGIAENSTCWFKAHAAFQSIRDESLALERESAESEKKRLRLAILYLAENVAKVVYNATEPSDEFDRDAGWWLVACLKDCSKILSDRGSEDALWDEIYREVLSGG